MSEAHPVNEAELQRRLIHQLDAAGWASVHVRRMYHPDRQVWLTGTSSPGFPDLLAVRGAYLLAIEVKGPKGRVSSEQAGWLERFATLPYGRALVLRPKDDWPTVVSWLADPGGAPRRYGWVAPTLAAVAR